MINDEELEYTPYTWELNPLEYWDWQSSEEGIKLTTEIAKDHKFDRVKFGTVILWESEKWKKIKESING